VRVDYRDREFLQSLAPIEIAAYLRSRGWHEQPGPTRDSALFTLGTDYEVTLPLSSALRDFAYRMIDAIKTLEIAEDRGQAEILADLAVSASDVVRVRLADPDARDGSLPLGRASEVISHAYDMLLAAACAAVEPKYYFSSHKPQAALDYMRSVRMGQTERGSFVLTILSRVTPDLVQPYAGVRDVVPEPFERMVTRRLAVALAAIDASAKAAIATGNIDTFGRSVEQGVSANLCDALAGMSETDGVGRDVDISLAWARVRPTTHSPFVRYQVGRDIVPVLREVARVFKSRAPQE
jgi:hypothetical protein